MLAEEETAVSRSVASAAARAVAGIRPANSASDGGQIEEVSGGGSSRKSNCGGIKMKREHANRINYQYYNDDGDNEDNSDGVYARRAGKQARVAGEIRYLIYLLRGTCRCIRII